MAELSYWFGVPDASIEGWNSGGSFDFWFGVPFVRGEATKLYRWTGTEWLPTNLYRYNGASWVSAKLKRWDGVNWINVN